MASDHYNGNSFEMGRMLGKLDAHMEIHTQILLDIREGIADLPTQIATTISTGSANRPSEAHGILDRIPPILKAFVPILTIIGLMTGRIAWTDIPGISNLLGP